MNVEFIPETGTVIFHYNFCKDGYIVVSIPFAKLQKLIDKLSHIKVNQNV